MTWPLRAVEQIDGSWLCGFGPVDLGALPDESQAVAYLVATALLLGGRHLFHIHLYGQGARYAWRWAADPLPGESATVEEDTARDSPGARRPLGEEADGTPRWLVNAGVRDGLRSGIRGGLHGRLALE